jgi:hypothetical protein
VPVVDERCCAFERFECVRVLCETTDLADIGMVPAACTFIHPPLPDPCIVYGVFLRRGILKKISTESPHRRLDSWALASGKTILRLRTADGLR